jgi:hypothetical protein
MRDNDNDVDNLYIYESSIGNAEKSYELPKEIGYNAGHDGRGNSHAKTEK